MSMQTYREQLAKLQKEYMTCIIDGASYLNYLIDNSEFKKGNVIEYKCTKYTVSGYHIKDFSTIELFGYSHSIADLKSVKIGNLAVTNEDHIYLVN